MDYMTMYEARDIAKNVLYVDKNDRELTRYQLYVAVQSNSKRQFTPEEILSLPWDDKWLDQKEFTYNEEEEKRTQKAADAFADMLNNGMIDFQRADMMKNEQKSTKKID